MPEVIKEGSINVSEEAAKDFQPKSIFGGEAAVPTNVEITDDEAKVNAEAESDDKDKTSEDKSELESKTIETIEDLDTSKAEKTEDEALSDDSEKKPELDSNTIETIEELELTEEIEDEDPATTEPTTIQVGEDTLSPDQAASELSELRKFKQEVESDAGLRGIIDAYNAGDLGNYLQANNVDYSKVSDVDMLKSDFAKRFDGTDVAQSAIDAAFNKELTAKYSIGVEDVDPNDKTIGEAMLRRDADILRKSKIEEQSKYTIPEKKFVDSDEVINNYKAQVQEQADAQAQEFVNQMKNDPFTKKFNEKPVHVVEYGGKKYGYASKDVAGINENIIAPQTILNNFQNDDGSIDMAGLTKLAEIAKNINAYEKALMDMGRSIERKEYVKESKKIVTPTDKQKKQAIKPENDPKAALAAAIRKGGIKFS